MTEGVMVLLSFKPLGGDYFLPSQFFFGKTVSKCVNKQKKSTKFEKKNCRQWKYETIDPPLKFGS